MSSPQFTGHRPQDTPTGAWRTVGRGLRTALLTLLLAGTSAFGETSNRIVAIVDQEVITEADVRLHLSALLEEDPRGAAANTGASEEMQRVALFRLIEQRLILQEAKRLELLVDGTEVADRIDALRRRLGSEQALRYALTEADLPMEQLKQQIREQLLVKKVIDIEVRSKITVSPAEVAEELGGHPEASESGEHVDVSHILVRVGDSRSEEQAKALIDDIYRALEGGEDFGQLARQHSEEPHAAKGGAMGWVGPGTLMPELDTVAFSLKEGTFSMPIQTRLGFHIVNVARRRTVASRSAREVKRSIEQRLFQRKFHEAFTEWLSELKRRAYIEIRTES